MFSAKLVVGGVEIAVGNEFLEQIAVSIPDRPEHQELFEALAKSPAASTREAIAQRENLTEATVLALAEDKSRGVIRRLIDNDAISKMIPMGRVEELIATNDPEILMTIVLNLENLTQLDTARTVASLAKHADPDVRLCLLRSTEIPGKLLRQLVRDEDPDVRAATLKKMDESWDDVDDRDEEDE